MHRKSSKTNERAKETERKEIEEEEKKEKMWTNRTDKTVIRQEPSHNKSFSLFCRIIHVKEHMPMSMIVDAERNHPPYCPTSRGQEKINQTRNQPP